ncbi:MAG: NUDIX hydrolase [Chromatiales bacterium]|jgi:8-oxo-dGTP diphosphatase|nr:NUDIX hydrolase [Chromatiales bacterium]
MRPQTPLITADAVIELRDRPGRPIVLIERRHEPLGWALPGGFVDIGETVEHAALREAREETGLDVRLEALLGCYSKPDRDPRGHTVSIIFVAVASGDPVAGDDAREVGVFDPAKTPPLAFDHQQVLADFIRWRERR